MSEKTCLFCGDDFRGRSSQQYCSRRCGNAVKSQRMKGQPPNNKGKSWATRLVRACGYCRSDFDVKGRSQRFRARRGVTVYCSDFCYRKGAARKISRTLMGHPGHQPSPEGRERQRLAGLGNKWSLGRRLTPEQRAKRSGPNSPSWKGGRTKPYARLRSKAENVRWAKAVKTRDNYTCESCGVQDFGRKRMHADHIKSFAEHPELRLDLSNGRTLCCDCHRKTGTYGRRSAA